MSKMIPIDVFDPIDIAIMVDPEIEKLVDNLEENEDDLLTVYQGLKEASLYDDVEGDFVEEDDEPIDTFNAIDDNSVDFLDMEADDIIENLEDDDGDGELIDMIINAYNHQF